MELTLFISQSLLKTLPMTESEAGEEVKSKAGEKKDARAETKQHQRLDVDYNLVKSTETF